MPQGKLQGLKEIAEHFGLQADTDSRRVLHAWITREGLPVTRFAGRWIADAQELDAWWARSRDNGAARPAPRNPRARGAR